MFRRDIIIMQTIKQVKFLNLFSIAPHMSVTAKVSILHRITGFILFLAIPLILFLLKRALLDNNLQQTLYGDNNPAYLFVLYLILSWSMVFYLCAEVRFLLIDANIGVSIKKARVSAWIVVVFSIVLTILLGSLIW